MKYNILKIILLLVLFTNDHIAQGIIPIENRVRLVKISKKQTLKSNACTYYKDINNLYDKFVGKWKYEKNCDLVEIIIYKIEKKDHNYYYRDELCIVLRYTKDGIIIIDKLERPNENYFNCLISGGQFNIVGKTNPNRIFLLFDELSDHWICGRSSPLNIEYNADNTLNWKIERPNKTTELMPLTMVFIKQP